MCPHHAIGHRGVGARADFTPWCYVPATNVGETLAVALTPRTISTATNYTNDLTMVGEGLAPPAHVPRTIATAIHKTFT